MAKYCDYMTNRGGQAWCKKMKMMCNHTQKNPCKYVYDLELKTEIFKTFITIQKFLNKIKEKIFKILLTKIKK